MLQRSALHHGERCKGRSGDALLRRSAAGFWLLLTLVLQVIVKGKVRAQRAKAMKFGDGYMVSSGHPAKIYLEKAFTHVQMRQGSIGIKVRARLSLLLASRMI